MAEINPEYERGFKDGLKSKIGEELQPMIAQVLEDISEVIKGLIPHMIDIMEITANLDANDWIPCSERLPKYDTEVLTYSPYHGMSVIISQHFKILGVTHWQPLPEPPKGVEVNDGSN